MIGKKFSAARLECRLFTEYVHFKGNLRLLGLRNRRMETISLKLKMGSSVINLHLSDVVKIWRLTELPKYISAELVRNAQKMVLRRSKLMRTLKGSIRTSRLVFIHPGVTDASTLELACSAQFHEHFAHFQSV